MATILELTRKDLRKYAKSISFDRISFIDLKTPQREIEQAAIITFTDKENRKIKYLKDRFCFR